MEKADIYGYIIVAVFAILMALISWSLCIMARRSDDREQEYWRERQQEEEEEEELKKCPFCGEDAKIVFLDDEGNTVDEAYEKYNKQLDASYAIVHENNGICPIAKHSNDKKEVVGNIRYKTKDLASEAWNKRCLE